MDKAFVAIPRASELDLSDVQAANVQAQDRALQTSRKP